MRQCTAGALTRLLHPVSAEPLLWRRLLGRSGRARARADGLAQTSTQGEKCGRRAMSRGCLASSWPEPGVPRARRSPRAVEHVHRSHPRRPPSRCPGTRAAAGSPSGPATGACSPASSASGSLGPRPMRCGRGSRRRGSSSAGVARFAWSLRVRAPVPARLAVSLVRVRDRAVLRRWRLGAMAPDSVRSVVWRGRRDGSAPRMGRYRFLVPGGHRRKQCCHEARRADLRAVPPQVPVRDRTGSAGRPRGSGVGAAIRARTCSRRAARPSRPRAAAALR